MGKMLISAWLAVASGKLGGRSLTGDANNDPALLTNDLLKKIGTSAGLEEAVPAVVSNPVQVPVNEPRFEQQVVKPVGGEKGGDGLETGSVKEASLAASKETEGEEKAAREEGELGGGVEEGSSELEERSKEMENQIIADTENEEDLELEEETDLGNKQEGEQGVKGGQQGVETDKKLTKEELESLPQQDVIVNELPAVQQVVEPVGNGNGGDEEESGLSLEEGSVSAASPASLTAVSAPVVSADEEEKDLLAKIKEQLTHVVGGAQKTKQAVEVFNALKTKAGGVVDDVKSFLDSGRLTDFFKKITDVSTPEQLADELTGIYGTLAHKVVEITGGKLVNRNDALVTYLKKQDGSTIKKVIFGAFAVHGILFFGDVILTFVPLPKFLRWIGNLVFGSSSIFFMITNGVAVWAAYTSESLEKTQKYYYVAGIYGAVQAADLITYFLGFGPLKIIYKFLSYGYKVVYLADAILVTAIPLYFVWQDKPSTFTAVGGDGLSWLESIYSR